MLPGDPVLSLTVQFLNPLAIDLKKVGKSSSLQPCWSPGPRAGSGGGGGGERSPRGFFFTGVAAQTLTLGGAG